MSEADNLKLKVARTIKWNAIDRVATQLLYAVTGVVLARLLSHSDYGLVAAIMVFQAFATLFVDSGFASALIQRKKPSHLDYSTVMWFNIGVAVVIYIILFFAAPLIADIFKKDMRIIPLSRVMFLTFIINATAIVPANRLVKMMQVKMIAVSNSVGLVFSAVVGITLALTGWGAWALVWQAITLATVKSAILWLTSEWRPLLKFSVASLRSFFNFGSGVMATSFLNVAFQEIYAFFIGNRVGLVSLGCYSQADKWSKMGISSLAQVLGASFLPALSQVQDDPERFAAATSKMNRFTAYLLFPALGLLAVMAAPIFHSLFGTKWDASIGLFQILLVRGVFTVLQSLYNNYIMALGRSRLMIYTELLRDITAIIAILVTLPYISLSSPDSLVEGVKIFLWGQLAASALTWVATLLIAVRLCHRPVISFLLDLTPYLMETLLILVPVAAIALVVDNPLVTGILQGVTGIALYMGINALLGSRIQRDVIGYFAHRFKG